MQEPNAGQQYTIQYVPAPTAFLGQISIRERDVPSLEVGDSIGMC